MLLSLALSFSHTSLFLTDTSTLKQQRFFSSSIQSWFFKSTALEVNVHNYKALSQSSPSISLPLTTYHQPFCPQISRTLVLLAECHSTIRVYATAATKTSHEGTESVELTIYSNLRSLHHASHPESQRVYIVPLVEIPDHQQSPLDSSPSASARDHLSCIYRSSR